MPRNGRKRLLLLLLRVSFAGSQLGKAEYLCHLAPVILRLVRSSFLFVAFVCAASWMATHDLPLRKTCFVFSAFFFHARHCLGRTVRTRATLGRGRVRSLCHPSNGSSGDEVAGPQQPLGQRFLPLLRSRSFDVVARFFPFKTRRLRWCCRLFFLSSLPSAVDILPPSLGLYRLYLCCLIKGFHG